MDRIKVNRLQKFLAIMIVFALMFTPGGRGIDSARAAQCTAQTGQVLIDTGKYKQAVNEFTCLINAQPTEVEGYRGRIEAELLLGRYSDAVRDYTRVTALVLPIHPEAESIILAGYDARLAATPDSIPALMGKSFAHWWFFNYLEAIRVLNDLLEIQPDSPYGNLFRGSSRILQGVTRTKGVADLEQAITLAPQSPDVRYIVADAYTYGLSDPQRAFAEASLALEWGLDTPRVHAILAASYNAFGDQLSAAEHIQTHIDLVTTELRIASPIASGASLNLDLVPGRTYEIPVPAVAGETISITTSSPDFWDSILVLLTPDGMPILGSDDDDLYFAAFEYAAAQTGTYRIQVTSFESVSSGILVVTRD